MLNKKKEYKNTSTHQKEFTEKPTLHEACVKSNEANKMKCIIQSTDTMNRKPGSKLYQPTLTSIDSNAANTRYFL